MSKQAVPFVVLENTDQAADIAASKGPNDIFQQCYRVKQYVKDDEMKLGRHPNDLEFNQPYQVARDTTTLDWNQCNRTFLAQMAGCNLRCPYCFTGEQSETKMITPAEYVQAYREYNNTHPEKRAGVLRVSGGEPLMTNLKQEWVANLISEELENHFEYAWIDTNLTRYPTHTLKHALQYVKVGGWGDNVGICGCFKPGVDGVDIYKQLEIAHAFAEITEIFFYWPSWGSNNVEFISFLHALEKAIPFAPLRLTVIHIKYHYAAITQDKQTTRQECETSDNNFRNMRIIWKQFCKDTYPPELLWLPSHQVKIG